jgi:hypothetical protein
MKKNTVKRMVIPVLVFGMVLVMTILGLRNTVAAGISNGSALQSLTASPAANGAAGNPAVLDAHRRMALGMIETGNRDDEIGGAGEVSRYQIMPSVWRQYSQSQNYRNPDVSLAVAQKHWARLYAGFVRQAHRQPNDFDMYVLWNTHYGYYASKGFNPNRLCSAVRDRAQRYVNLVQCDDL